MAFRASNQTPRSLPKFGEWDVNNPESAEGFTVIFNKARDQKKTGGGPSGGHQEFDQQNANRQNNRDKRKPKNNHQDSALTKWLCCFGTGKLKLRMSTP